MISMLTLFAGVHFQTANGLGEAHETSTGSFPFPFELDIAPIDFSSVSIPGGINITPINKIYGSFAKGLKELNSANSIEILETNYDRINDGADAVASFGMTQAF